MKEVLLLLSMSVERRAERVGLYGEGITIKITYADMKTITRSKPIRTTRSAWTLYREAERLLDQTPGRPVRLIGVSLSHLSGEENRQLRFEDVYSDLAEEGPAQIKYALEALHRHYHLDFAGNLDKIFRSDTLYKTIEYMRKHING